MKYLSTYILFKESTFHTNLNDELPPRLYRLPIIEDVKDILLELLDDGFTIEIYSNASWRADGTFGFDNPETIVIDIKKITGKFESIDEIMYSEISDVVDRLEEYLGDKLVDISEWDDLHQEWVPMLSDLMLPQGSELPNIPESYSISGLKISFNL